MKKISLPLIENLVTSKVVLQDLIDEIPVGMFILDQDRNILLLNRALEALTGFSRDEVKDIPCYHILRNGLCIKGCPGLKMDRDSEAICMESDIINKDRQRFPVRINLAPLRDEKNELIGFVETVEDLRPFLELDAKFSHAFRFSQLVGRSPQMEKIFQILPILAQNDSSVLITGETGTGKDLVAEAAHQASNRSKGPFIKVNCGALPENLLESELFGHQKGAFTGATENKPGRFRLAHNGTLFLTEIGDLPLTLQVKLLTFLDDQVIFPLGSTKGFQANVRVIGGTHRNLEKMVREGTFREDLLFRLNVVRIHLPPLREREGDLRLLLDHFLNSFKNRFQKSIKGLAEKTLRNLESYAFPGNVRELRNIVEYAVNVCQDDYIQPQHLPAYLFESVVEPQETSPVTGSIPNRFQKPNRISNSNQTWSEVERQMIIDALQKVGGRKNEAADILGWGRSTLWRKMKRYQIY